MHIRCTVKWEHLGITILYCALYTKFSLCYNAVCILAHVMSAVCACSGLTVIIVLDLSKPEHLWNTLEVLLKQVYTVMCVFCVHVCMYVCMYVYVWIDVCACVCRHAHPFVK